MLRVGSTYSFLLSALLCYLRLFSVWGTRGRLICYLNCEISCLKWSKIECHHQLHKIWTDWERRTLDFVLNITQMDRFMQFPTIACNACIFGSKVMSYEWEAPYYFHVKWMWNVQWSDDMCRLLVRKIKVCCDLYLKCIWILNSFAYWTMHIELMNALFSQFRRLFSSSLNYHQQKASWWIALREKDFHLLIAGAILTSFHRKRYQKMFLSLKKCWKTTMSNSNSLFEQ